MVALEVAVVLVVGGSIGSIGGQVVVALEVVVVEIVACCLTPGC